MQSNFPITNQAAADKAKAATNIHLKQQMRAGQAPQNQEALGKLAAATTTAAGAADVAAKQGELKSDVGMAQREATQTQQERARQNIASQDRLAGEQLANKNKLVDMQLGIEEEEFLDQQRLRALEQQGDFQHESEIADLARMQLGDDAEYQEALQMANQEIQRRAAEDEWKVNVFERALQNKEVVDRIAKDTEFAAEFKRRKMEAERQAEASKRKSAKTGKMIGAAKIVVGVAVGGPVGGGIAASAASNV